MIIESHDNLKEPRKFRASRVVITDDVGNPLVVVIKIGTSEKVLVAGSKGFEESCRMLGIDRTVVITNIETKKPTQIML